MSKPPFALMMRRGMRRRCPCCGQGKLFSGYLTPVAACAVCDENFAGVRADDGPAWLTILVVGHILAPLFVEMVRHPVMPEWMISATLCGLAVVLMAILLPVCKGLFMAAIWWHQKPVPPAL